MTSLPVVLASLPLRNLRNSPKPTSPVPDFDRTHVSSLKILPKFRSSLPSLQLLAKAHLCVTVSELVLSLPTFASESATSLQDPVSGKIDLESVLVSIDDFFNRYPFFVAGCTFVWLVVVPVVKFYLSKCKPISAINAFRKLKNQPNSQLLDIRDEKTLASLASPNLKVLGKRTVQVQFSEGDESEFLKKVKESFPDPENTVVCVLDNFDGNSSKAAELLFKNGFKETYALKGGVRGKDGWLAIQEELLPPFVHIYAKKKVKSSEKLEVNGAVNQRTSDKNEVSQDSHSKPVKTLQSQMQDDEQASNGTESVKNTKSRSRPLSPYPNYPDLKPPSSPTPSKP